MLQQELTMLGLNDKEAEIYLAALHLGYCTVSEIADKANINRTSAYTHIKNLIAKGLIATSEKMGKVFFVAARPEKLQHIYEVQEKEIQRKRDLLNELLPQLESIYSLAKDKPSVKYFEHHDSESLRSLRQEILSHRREIAYNIFNYEKYQDFISKSHINSLLDNCDSYRALYISKNKIVDLRLRDFLQNEKFSLRHLPADKFDFLCEILILGQRVYISKQDNSLLIQDPLFSQTLTLLFQALWGIGQKIT